MPTILSNQLPPIKLNNCLQEITSNLLKLNSSKTELMVVAPAPLLKKVGDLDLVIDACSTSLSLEVPNLGVILDSTLSFRSHIKSTTKSAFFHLPNILVSGLPHKALKRQQYVQNSAARLLTRTKDG